MALLEISNLTVDFATYTGSLRAVDGINLSVDEREILAIVGESGSGKSVAMLALMGLLPWTAKVSADSMLFDSQDLLSMNDKQRRKIIGKDISMIFQEPMTSLNPIFTIGDQIMEAIRLHQDKTESQARELALQVLRQVAIPSPEIRIDQYPHELSGGMKQRVMIAMAIVCRPALLIADEPTTALDVTIQAQILDLLDQLRKETQMAILLITHNLGIVAQYADRVAVMYSGKVVESAPVEELFFSPKHPYTRGLLNSLPKDNPSTQLETIPGSVPHPAYLPEGCAFHPRCAEKLDKCLKMIPPLESLDSGNPHQTACWLYETTPPA